MKLWWLLFLLAFFPFDGIQRIALRNQYVQQAHEAYTRKNYLRAAALYERVRLSEGTTPPPAVLLNLAHSYFHLHEYSRASPLYRALLKTPDVELLSLVATQLSIIEAEEGNFTKALDYSVQALKADDQNSAARFNYELLQKYLVQHPEKRKSIPPPQRRQPQEGAGAGQRQNTSGSPSTGGKGVANSAGGASNSPSGRGVNPTAGQNKVDQRQEFGKEAGQSQGISDRGGQDSNGGPGNTATGQEQDALLQTRVERLKKLQLSPEKARQLLDAMRQEEAQYLQQVPRKSSKKKINNNTPDW